MDFIVPINFPPTPASSIGSPRRRRDSSGLPSHDLPDHFSKADIMFQASEAGPSTGFRRQPPYPVQLPPTPPNHAGESEQHSHFAQPRSATGINFSEPVLPQRPRKGRRPLSSYPAQEEERVYQPHRKYTDPTPRSRPFAEQDTEDDLEPARSGQMPQQLDVDLNAYSTADFEDVGLEEGREPTLSFVTSSTAESTTSTPAIGVNYGYKSDSGVVVEGKPDATGEPRIRMRTTQGRANAYSSAESSMASGAYSYAGYADTNNNVYHPHPPPLPVMPNAFAVGAEHVGLGITADDAVVPSSAQPSPLSASAQQPAPISPTTSFAHRPWKRDIATRLRSDSASSSITTASASTEASAAASQSGMSYNFGNLRFSDRLPWEKEEDEEAGRKRDGEAVVMVDQGREQILDKTRVDELGGIEGLTQEVIASFAGTTHLLLPAIGSDILPVLPDLLSTLAPTLVVLDMAGNDLSFLPEALAQCQSLEELNISGNPLRQIPGWLSELSSLRMLVMDGCGVQNLPAELARLTSLHTLCIRDNRLVSLPSWLCLLGNLETLRVDDNPFTAEWLPIVTPILSLPPLSARPTVPPRGASSFGALQSAPSATSIASSRTVSSFASRDADAGHDWMNASNASAQSVYSSTPGSGLGPIAEDSHPHSAPLAWLNGDNETDQAASSSASASESPRNLRKMRSAGDLLGQHRPITPTPQRPVDASAAPLAPPPMNRFASLGSRRAASAMGSYDDAEEQAPASGPATRLAPPTSAGGKSGKWGFLRKMSMSRLRSSDSKANLTVSASANLKSLPPPPSLPQLRHADSDPIYTLPVIRPPMGAGSRSAMTLPTRRVLGADGGIGEFGQAPPGSAKSGASMPSSAGLPAANLIFGTTSSTGTAVGLPPVTPLRGKRRSFLPIPGDGPPSININIPSVSPFMSTVPTLTSAPAAQAQMPVALSEATIADATMTMTESPSDLVDPEARYAVGLESIKSYLRDLFDLSRPPIEPYGGFEVLPGGAGETDYPGSPATQGSGNSHSRPGSISEARRKRRPTLDTQTSRNASVASIIDEDHTTSSAESGKKFKNDKSKRAKVVREIWETERTYVRGLGELVSIYVKPAAQPVVNKLGVAPAAGSETMIPLAERKIVFGGIESILTIHRDNLLPALEKAVRPLLEGTDDEAGNLSALAAHSVGEVFRTYIAYMKQYSTYINNFDNALSRMKTWTAPSTPVIGGGGVSGSGGKAMGNSNPGTPAMGIGAGLVGAGMSAISLPMAETMPHSGGFMAAGQRKRVKAFLKRCREHPMHSQINLESYLLLPIQRVPRYKLLLEDLAMCTPPRMDGPRDTLDDALNEIASLASLMNEEKRDSDSRLRLFHWQQRISSRGPSPLVQPHRKLILDGPLNLIRLVKKASAFVEVDNLTSPAARHSGDGEHTIMPGKSKIVVPVEYIAPEPMDRSMMLILCTDLLVLVQQRPGGGERGWDGQVDLFNVLRMATLREPASIVHGNVLRVVDNKSIYYFNGGSTSSTLQWCRAINTARRR